MKKINKNFAHFSDHLDQRYGKRKIQQQERNLNRVEVFKREVMLREKVNENLKQEFDLKSIAKGTKK
ncbi:MAG: hypothetical protein R3A12_11855 [Ignavibacteria bacterium]